MNTAPALTVPAAARPLGALDTLHFHEVLTCQLGGVSYGISLRSVQEIRSFEAPTRLANAPACVKGVIDLRGIVVPIVDMRLRFGLLDAGYTGTTVTIVLNIGGRTVGMVVDSVSDVIGLSAAQIKPAPSFSTTHDGGSFIAGIATPDAADPQRLLVLLNIDALISSAAIGLFEQSLH